MGMMSMLRPKIAEAMSDTAYPERASLRPPVLVALFFVLFFVVIAIRLGTDATPDFRIYHYYNGFAAFHDRSALDVAAAQMQTTMFNGVDGVDYLLIRALQTHQAVLNGILSLPYAVAALCVFVLSKLFFPNPRLLSHAVCAASAVFGLTGAGTLPTLATAMTDITAAMPMLIASAYWFANERLGRNDLRRTALAGLLAGLAVGLKLTLVPVFIGLFVAIAARWLTGTRPALRQAVMFGATGVLMFVAVDLGWMLHNVRAYGGNPIFPIMNNVFQSDYAVHAAWTDTRFFPKTLKMALFYPAYWTFRISQDAIELPMRDPRILIGCLSALLIVAMAALRRVAGGTARRTPTSDRLAVSLALIYLTAYTLWEFEWSIYRYLAVEECLTGVMLLAACSVCLRARSQLWIVLIFVVITVPALAVTKYPWWGRAIPATRAVSVALPITEPNAMVLFLDPYAYSYLVPSMPRTVRVVGANSNLIRPGAPGKLEEQAEAAINGHKGPFWGLDFEQAFPGVADATLRFYHLHRDTGTCQILQSNIEDGPHIRICRLDRDAVPGPASR